MTNREIVKILRDIAAAYEVKSEPFYKVAAYNRAADSIEQYSGDVKDLWEEGKLDSLPGLGKSLIAYLDELFKKGRVKHFEEIKKGLPSGMFVINGIPGIGPKTAYQLASELNVKNIEDLKAVAQKGLVRNLPGFGEKSEEEILNSLLQISRRTGRVLLPTAFETAQKIMEWIKKEESVEKIDPLGSLRRRVPTIGDIDISVASKNPANVIKRFLDYPKKAKEIEAGPKSASILLENGLQVDLKIVEPDAYGALLQHFTGSKEHNIHLRELALKKGYSLSEYGIKIGNKIENFSDEKGFYQKLGLDLVPPELREDRGEIEAAINHNLPKLVELKDVKGDMHLHSSYDVETSHDLGKDDFETLARRGEELGYEYVGFANHTPALGTHTKGEIEAIVKAQIKYIEQLKSSRVINILNGFEVDILPDGEVSLPDSILQKLDFVIAGIHSSMRIPKDKMTKRLMRAIDNPLVDIISHPTGRLLNEREGYELDWEEIFKACILNNKILEINAWPARLDLIDYLVKEAVKRDVKMIINTDAHSAEQMNNMSYGVSVARRGWAEKKNILNTLPWIEFKKLFRVK